MDDNKIIEWKYDINMKKIIIFIKCNFQNKNLNNIFVMIFLSYDASK